MRFRIKSKIQSAKNRVGYLIQNAVSSKVLLPAVYLPQLDGYKPRATARRLPCFLVLRYKYCHGDKRFGISNEEQAVSAPLRSAKVAETVEYYFDLNGSGGIFRERELVNLVTSIRPDLIILSSYNHLDNTHPCFEVLKAIRERCKIPLVAIWHDSSGELAIKQCAYMLNDIDLHILLDSGVLYQHFSDRANFLRLWAPLDFSVYHPGDGRRDIPISFLGSTGAYRGVRKQYLEFLQEQQIDVYHSGGQAEQLMDLESYADILRRSKISLNFSHSVAGTNQLKFRVFEILFSGALLLENENSETKRYFTPMVDYVVFNSKEDLRDKVRYYLHHEDERQRIASNGYMKATQEYNHKVFWDKVIDNLAELNLLHAPYASEAR